MFRRLVAIAALAAALPLAGCNLMLPDDRPRVSIEFGVAPEILEGREVVVDGRIVGRLERVGQATRNAFPLEEGEHDVWIRHERFASRKARVAATMKGQKVHLLAELADEASPDGSIRTVIVLR